METRGRLQLDGALVTDIEVKSVHTHLDYIAIALESDEFVSILGSSRIRLVFVGCQQSGFDLCMWSGHTIHSFHITDILPDTDNLVSYRIEMSDSDGALEIVAKGVHVEINKTTHQHH